VIGFQCWSVAFLLSFAHSGFSLASEMELSKTRMVCVGSVVVREGRISDDRNRRCEGRKQSQQSHVLSSPRGGKGGCSRARPSLCSASREPSIQTVHRGACGSVIVVGPGSSRRSGGRRQEASPALEERSQGMREAFV